MIEKITEARNGCEICVIACPKNALEMRPSASTRKGAVAYIAHPALCYVYYQCEGLCRGYTGRS